MHSIAAGIVLSGLTLSVVFLPLSYAAAIIAGRDPLVSILLTQSGHDLSSFVALRSLSDVQPGELSTIFGLLAFSGLCLLALPLIFLVVRHKGFIRLMTLSYGMVLGLSLTLVWFEWTSTGHVALFAPRAMEIGYIYLAFLFAEGSKVALEHKGLLAIPYTYAIDGIFGTITVLIISYGYRSSFADVLLGPFFLIAVAITIFISEWMILRPATILLAGTGQALADPGLIRFIEETGTTAKQRLKFVLWMVRKKIGEAAKLSYPRRAKLLEEAGAKVIRMIPKSPSFRIRQVDWNVVAIIGAINLLFPLLALLAAWLVF
jgi:hypothetical protein